MNTNLTKELHKRTCEIHIKSQQRNGRKCWTFVEGIDQLENQNLNEIATNLKKKFNCGASIKNNVIQLNGDHKTELKEYLIKQGIANDDQIKIHGI